MRSVKCIRYVVGVDEAGRGPLAGSVCVGVVMVPARLRRSFHGVRDSKKLTPAAREVWLSHLRENHYPGVCFTAATVGPRKIDEAGIVRAVRVALSRALRRLKVDPARSLVLLDGGLSAPRRFVYQRTLTRGEEKEHVIALASIVAKTHRDRMMVRLSREYVHWGFDVHKGYGTRLHFDRIRAYGFSDIHRRSFLKSFARPMQV